MPGRENWTATRFPISEIDKCCWRDMNSEHVLAKERKMVCFRFRSFPSLALNQKNWRLGLDTSLSCFIAFECKPQNNIYHFFHRLASCFLELSFTVWDRPRLKSTFRSNDLRCSGMENIQASNEFQFRVLFVMSRRGLTHVHNKWTIR